jgi:hypothetical protein
MRRILSASIAGAALVAAMLFATPAQALSPSVLTTGSVGGPAVAVGDTLNAPSSGSVVIGPVTCTASAITAMVTSNPSSPGTATLTQNAWSFTGCTTTSGPATIAVNNLPYCFSVNSSGTVGLTACTSTVTVQLTIKITTVLGVITCVYRLTSVSITWSNTGNSITMTLTFTKVAGPSACPATITLTGKFAPVRDTSVGGSPLVFLQ